MSELTISKTKISWKNIFEALHYMSFWLVLQYDKNNANTNIIVSHWQGTSFSLSLFLLVHFFMGQLWYVPILKTATEPISVKDGGLLLGPIKAFTASHALLKLWGHSRSPWSSELHYQAPFVSLYLWACGNSISKSCTKAKGFLLNKDTVKNCSTALTQMKCNGIK